MKQERKQQEHEEAIIAITFLSLLTGLLFLLAFDINDLFLFFLASASLCFVVFSIVIEVLSRKKVGVKE